MKSEAMNDTLFNYLLRDISGHSFEELAKEIFRVEFGEGFVPLGGMHDGGADGIFLPMVLGGSKPNTFFQFSVTDTKKAKTKIIGTIEALRKAGRDPKQLIYSTTELLPKQDVLMNEIFDTYNVSVRIRDREKLKEIVNSSEKIQAIFINNFLAEIDAAAHASEKLKGRLNTFVKDPTVFAYLDFQIKDRFSKDSLHDKILDSLIYWSLRDTDPDKKQFKDISHISNTIRAVIPAAADILLSRFADRILLLTKKDNVGRERVRFHKPDLYCLPFEMRKALAEKAVEENSIQEEFLDSIEGRLKGALNTELSDIELETATLVTFNSLHEYFIEQGLILAAFLNKKVDEININDQIVEAQLTKVIATTKLKTALSPELIGRCMKVLGGIFYTPTPVEHKYLQFLSNTSLLFTTLNSAPKVIEYFNQMGGNFNLLIGTDLLLKAMSEQLLPPEHRQVEILLRICTELGASLTLAEPVLEELFTSLHAVDLEYRNHYLPNEAYLSPADLSECNRLLIRTYYYARRVGKSFQKGWDGFINQMVDPKELRGKTPHGRAQLKAYISLKYNLGYRSAEELLVGVNQAELEGLAESLHASRIERNIELSRNDSLMVFATYSQRRLNHESAIYDGFGYRTWWLTKETKILSHTALLVKKEDGTPYIMRPEFLLNFLMLASKASKAREAFSDILPTTVGLQLGHHLDSAVLNTLLDGVSEWANLPPERVSVMITDKINQLKYDRLKQYPQLLN